MLFLSLTYTEEVIKLKISVSLGVVFMRKRGILFDLDGTLINTYNNFDYSLIFKELNQTQKDLLLDILKKQIHSFAEMEKKVRLECTNKQEGEDLIQKIHAYLCMHYKEAELKKDALKFLHHVKEKGYTLCLCTNNASDIAQYILEIKHMENLFSYVITSQQVERSKPDPQIYEEALKAIHLSKHECIVFEDSKDGIQAAHSAGLEVIGVCSEETSSLKMCIQDYSDSRLYKEFI
jgi:HAD hydrolase, family IA, variant 3